MDQYHSASVLSQYLTFQAAGERYAVAIMKLREILPYTGVTKVPMAPGCIRGLINLRGQIVSILDLGIRLGLEPRTISGNSHNIILKTREELAHVRAREKRSDLETGDDPLGLLVDAVGDVVLVEEADIEPPPANAGGVDGHYVEGVVKLEEVLLVLLSGGCRYNGCSECPGLEPLSEFLPGEVTDEDARVRAYAAYALGQIGKASMPAVDTLIKNAFDQNELVRRASLRALRKIDPPQEKTMPLQGENW